MAKLICCLMLLLALPVWAQQAEPQSQEAITPQQVEQALQEHGFALLNDLPVKNQIPLFDNRFRVDDNVEEITLLLFRRRGSASVVLVKPDGSKVHFNTAEAQQVRWHDASSYDLIQIKNPMPGPWQAIGRLLPESRIMLLTEIRLQVDPLPANLMVGETVKISAKLTNGDEPITAKDFNEVLALEVIFVSTNNAEYDNFGRGVVQVAQFRDDGKGYDERARDGVFTGEFQLRFVAGEWTPKYIVRTPLYTREVQQAPVVLKPAPIVADITASPAVPDDKPEQEAIPHQVLFKVTDTSVNAESVLLQGRVRYPNGEVDSFALNEPGSTPRELKLHNRGHGSYILEVSAFGTMQDGREFMLNLPEVSFVVNRPVVEAVVLEELPQHIKDEIAKENAPPEPEFPWVLVIMANLVILGGGGVAIWLVMTDRKLADLMFWRKKLVAAPSTAKPAAAAAATDKNAPNVQKNNDMDDILDLTLPDD
ncbi:TIGR03503 family protein [Rheinheimera fenheensis]|uniref:TIGR03503 family protein n=1 Tax=Rheinheimera fenheensis TaxID=3152295 RepID=UPI00325DEB5C